MFHISIYGQVIEDFSDGEFHVSPPWYGQTESFRVNSSKQLQLNESGAGSAFLSTRSLINSQATWQFDIEMSFNPSARNFCNVYLISDSQDLSTVLNGYYIKIGGAQDEISLYRQDLSKHFKIIDGADGITDTPLVKLNIKVTRDANDKWVVFQSAGPGDQYQIVGESVDGTHQRASFFGIYCQFTSTRSKDFILDDIQVDGLLFSDGEPPVLQSLNILDRTRVELIFNEQIRIQELSQFNIVGQGEPIQLAYTGYNTWQIEFPFAFRNGIEYTLELNGIDDLFGNTLNYSRKFQFWEVGKAIEYDIIITEIMADPSPSLQLPEHEYLEILNIGDSAINLSNWTLSDATSKVFLPDYVLSPGDYLVLLPETAVPFPDEVTLLPLNSWPALNNSGDLIMLTDSLGNIIHFVNYSDSWYRNSLKQHGGWSLEMIDARYPCTGGPNWTASTAATGGTPGKINSVTTDNPDLTPPQIINTFAETPFELKVYFDQPLSPVSISTSQVVIEPGLQIDTFFVGSLAEPTVTIRLRDSLQTQVLYKITATGFADCNQNLNHQGSGWLVGLPQTADSGDLVISEILFNPKPLGTTFVEVFNRSGKAINLKNWRFARWHDQALSDFSSLSEENLMIYPGEYRVFTESRSKLESQYPRVASVIEVGKMTSMDEKHGNLVLLASGGYVVDEVNYHQDMHHTLLTDRNGVSLERANPEAASDDANNWFSGSEYTGYATPGFQNSQYFVSTTLETLAVEPKIISPASSRLPSYARISFSLESGGNSGSVLIFNRQGYLVKTLLNNSILPVSGTVQWDGTNDQAQRVPMGNYIIQLRVSNRQHHTGKWQETVAVVPDF